MNHIEKFLANDTKGFEARKELFKKALKYKNQIWYNLKLDLKRIFYENFNNRYSR